VVYWELMRFPGGGRDRFDFCAECLGSFITDNLGRTESDDELPMGFTVSRMEKAPWATCGGCESLRLIQVALGGWSSSLTLVRNPESTTEVSVRSCKGYIEVVLIRLDFVSSRPCQSSSGGPRDSELPMWRDTTSLPCLKSR